MHLNNKGYMLIEIVLASTLAIVVAVFLTSITIKLKNKNEDLLIRSLVSTDQGIIYNTIMKDVYFNYPSLSKVCENLNVEVENKKVTYNGIINIVNEHASVGDLECNYTNNVIVIPISVKQLPDENFDIVIKFNVR